MIPLIPSDVASMPYNTPVLNQEGVQDESLKTTGTIGVQWQGYLSNMQQNVDQLVSRGTPGILLNSDFNLLSANGTNPVTPAEGSDYEMVKKWYIVNGGGSNNYTITPTPHSTVNYFGTGSNNYLDVLVTTLTNDLYFYNKNYSTTSQFNSVSSYSGKPVNFSFSIENKGDSDEYLQFSAYMDGETFPDGSNEIFGEHIPLKPGFNIAGKEINLPELTGIDYDPTNFIQLRCYLRSSNSTGGAQMAINYLKAELSTSASYLEVNHVLDELVCNSIV